MSDFNHFDNSFGVIDTGVKPRTRGRQAGSKVLKDDELAKVDPAALAARQARRQGLARTKAKKEASATPVPEPSNGLREIRESVAAPGPSTAVQDLLESIQVPAGDGQREIPVSAVGEELWNAAVKESSSMGVQATSSRKRKASSFQTQSRPVPSPSVDVQETPIPSQSFSVAPGAQIPSTEPTMASSSSSRAYPGMDADFFPEPVNPGEPMLVDEPFEAPLPSGSSPWPPRAQGTGSTQFPASPQVPTAGPSGSQRPEPMSSPSYSTYEPPPRPEGPHDFTVWQGKPYKPDAETVTWACGTKTKLPYKVARGDLTKTNLVPHDTNHVRRLAAEARPAEESENFRRVIYDRNVSSKDVAQQVSSFQARGYDVVLTGFPCDYMNAEGKDFAWTTDSFRDNYMMSMETPYQMQDAQKRTDLALAGEDPEDAIYERYTMPEFIDHVNNSPDHVTAALLDSPAMTNDAPDFMKYMDKAHVSFLSNLGADPHRRSAPVDVHLAEFWSLHHTGGYHTYVHIDSEGYATHIQVVSGCKIWVFCRDKKLDDARTREDYAAANKRVGAATVQYRPDVERHYWVALPGDMIILCPGRMHTVFTPVPTSTTGGHFYSFETIHQTEATLFYNHRRKAVDTNFRHHSAPLTAALMLNSIKHQGERTYYRKALMAMCLLVTKLESYFRHDHDDPDLIYLQYNQVRVQLREMAGQEPTANEVMAVLVQVKESEHKKKKGKKRSAKKAKVQPPPGTIIVDPAQLVITKMMEDRKQALANARTIARYFKFDYRFDLIDNKQQSDYVFVGGIYDPGETVTVTRELLDRLNRQSRRRAGELDVFTSDYSTLDEDTESDEEDVAPVPSSSRSKGKHKAVLAKPLSDKGKTVAGKGKAVTGKGKADKGKGKAVAAKGKAKAVEGKGKGKEKAVESESEGDDERDEGDDEYELSDLTDIED
ncbi:hypothetical protein EIP91_010598 [Steccherinum ochraceum]|uniref:JmjC domain-containing protein n=1 Tax=Steccherinum ochraceum TaxID=92696 RepID=A0A4R0R307_9APHY|nr:hypothetical protein EIP91_010598 [Steccherinum ochraceum]